MWIHVYTMSMHNSFVMCVNVFHQVSKKENTIYFSYLYISVTINGTVCYYMFTTTVVVSSLNNLLRKYTYLREVYIDWGSKLICPSRNSSFFSYTLSQSHLTNAHIHILSASNFFFLLLLSCSLLNENAFKQKTNLLPRCFYSSQVSSYLSHFTH